MIKPRITWEYSKICHCMMWFCRGAGSLGLGYKPSAAYWDWRGREECRKDRLRVRRAMEGWT